MDGPFSECKICMPATSISSSSPSAIIVDNKIFYLKDQQKPSSDNGLQLDNNSTPSYLFLIALVLIFWRAVLAEDILPY